MTPKGLAARAQGATRRSNSTLMGRASFFCARCYRFWKRRHDGSGELFWQGEYVVNRPLVRIRPALVAILGGDQLHGQPDAPADHAHAPLLQPSYAERCPIARASTGLLLTAKLELAAATCSPGTRASALISSSVTPSLKYAPS